MTAFVKENFKWDGVFLMYAGPYEGQKTYDEVYAADRIHPSRIGMPLEAFIARFKYAPRPKAKWIRELVKNFSVEEYLALVEESSPRQAIESKGAVMTREAR